MNEETKSLVVYFLSVTRMFCSVTDNGEHRTLCGRVGTKLADFRCHEIPEVRSSELRQLTRDIIRWECRPYMAMQPPPLCYFLKLIAPCVVVLPLLRQRHLLTVLVLLSVLFCYVIPMKLGLGLKATIFGLALTGVRAS